MSVREHVASTLGAVVAAALVAAMLVAALRSCEIQSVGGYSCSAWLAQCAQHRPARDCYTDALVLGCSHRALGGRASLDRAPTQGGAHERDHAEGEHDHSDPRRQHVGAEHDDRNAHEQ